jgi:hypothetical protein
MRLILVTTLLWLAVFGVARADQTSYAAEVALDLARYAANEAGLRDGWGDAVLLWQVAETQSDTLEGRHRFLRRHSRCVLHPPTTRAHVTGAARATLLADEARHNCPWTRNLRRDGTRPEGWPSNMSWRYHEPLWLGLLAWCDRVVSDAIWWRPCKDAPMTWGGVPDHERAARLGMRRLWCIDPTLDIPTRNDGYIY